MGIEALGYIVAKCLGGNGLSPRCFIRCGSAKPVANYYGAVLCERNARCVPPWCA